MANRKKKMSVLQHQTDFIPCFSFSFLSKSLFRQQLQYSNKHTNAHALYYNKDTCILGEIVFALLFTIK